MATIDVALLAFGGPETVAQVPDFLRRMTRREPSPETLVVVEKRYQAIGGGSPLPDVTRRQARALEAEMIRQLGVGVRVRPGFLYADPTVADCLAELEVRDALALPMSPFSSRLTTSAYRRALDDAGASEMALVDGWHADRRFVAVVTSRIAEALDGADVSDYAVMFTAHSIPVEIAMSGDPYVEQLQHTVAQLVQAITPGDWRLAFQSRGRSGGEWIGPEADEVARELAAEGWKKVLVVPVGFVADHVETLFDLDIDLRAVIETQGMSYRRSVAPNDSPRFIEAMADIVIDHLAHRPLLHSVELDPAGSHFHGAPRERRADEDDANDGDKGSGDAGGAGGASE